MTVRNTEHTLRNGSVATLIFTGLFGIVGLAWVPVAAAHEGSAHAGVPHWILLGIVLLGIGKFLTASKHEHPELFWGIRGGGGNFGIVTSFEYRLHPVGPEVMFAAPMYPLEAAREILPVWRD